MRRQQLARTMKGGRCRWGEGAKGQKKTAFRKDDFSPGEM